MSDFDVDQYFYEDPDTKVKANAAGWHVSYSAERRRADKYRAEAHLLTQERDEAASQRDLYAEQAVKQAGNVLALVTALRRITEVQPPMHARTDYEVYGGMIKQAKQIARAALKEETGEDSGVDRPVEEDSGSGRERA